MTINDDKATTSRYDNDPRVKACNGGYVVHRDGTDFYVLDSGLLGWGVFTGPNLDLVQVTDGQFAIGIINADDAIAALIGEPR